MKRLKWLVLLGLALAVVAVAYRVITRGGVADSIGLEVEFITDLRDWDNPRREVRLHGPDLLSDLMAARMKLTSNNGWQRAAEIDEAGYSYLRLWKESAEGRLPDWSWSKTSLDATGGLFATDYVYEEHFTRGLFAEIHEVRSDWLQKLTSEQRKTIEEEFHEALKETGHRVDVAFDDLVLDVHVRLFVKMPREIRESQGFGDEPIKGNTVCLATRRSQIKPTMRLRVVASGASAWGYILIVLLVIIIGGITYVILRQRHRKRFLERLKEELDDGENE